MKHSILFTLLLGFGFMLPATCSKKSSKQKTSNDKNLQTTPVNSSKLALFGPTGRILMQSRTAQILELLL